MSPGSRSQSPAPAAAALAMRLAAAFGAAVHEERTRRRTTAAQLATRARVSRATVTNVEAGRPASLDVWARLATALGLDLESRLGNGRSTRARQSSDLVHAAMGEWEAGRLSRHGLEVAIDHPYQHYQFAGRADVLAWSVNSAALLHIENRTQLPNLGETAGSFNAKCQYLAPRVAEWAGLRRFASQTHVLVGLWSAELIHAVRLRPASLRAIAPDDETRLLAWLRGEPPAIGHSRSFVLLDPLASGRQRPIIGLDAVLAGTRPRVRGYAEAAERLGADRS